MAGFTEGARKFSSTVEKRTRNARRGFGSLAIGINQILAPSEANHKQHIKPPQASHTITHSQESQYSTDQPAPKQTTQKTAKPHSYTSKHGEVTQTQEQQAHIQNEVTAHREHIDNNNFNHTNTSSDHSNVVGENFPNIVVTSAEQTATRRAAKTETTTAYSPVEAAETIINHVQTLQDVFNTPDTGIEAVLSMVDSETSEMNTELFTSTIPGFIQELQSSIERTLSEIDDYSLNKLANLDQATLVKLGFGDLLNGLDHTQLADISAMANQLVDIVNTIDLANNNSVEAIQNTIYDFAHGFSNLELRVNGNTALIAFLMLAAFALLKNKNKTRLILLIIALAGCGETTIQPATIEAVVETIITEVAATTEPTDTPIEPTVAPTDTPKPAATPTKFAPATAEIIQTVNQTDYPSIIFSETDFGDIIIGEAAENLIAQPPISGKDEDRSEERIAFEIDRDKMIGAYEAEFGKNSNYEIIVYLNRDGERWGVAFRDTNSVRVPVIQILDNDGVITNESLDPTLGGLSASADQSDNIIISEWKTYTVPENVKYTKLVSHGKHTIVLGLDIEGKTIASLDLSFKGDINENGWVNITDANFEIAADDLEALMTTATWTEQESNGIKVSELNGEPIAIMADGTLIKVNDSEVFVDTTSIRIQNEVAFSNGQYGWNQVPLSTEAMQRITDEGIEINVEWSNDKETAEITLEKGSESILIATLSRNNSEQIRLDDEDSLNEAMDHGVSYVLGELEPTPEPSPTPTETPMPTPTAEPTEVPTAEPAGSVEMSDVAAEAFEEIRGDLEGRFPKTYESGFGAYSITCVADDVQVHFDNPITISPGYEAMVTAECYYLDANNDKQHITVPLVVYKPDSQETLVGDVLLKMQFTAEVAFLTLLENTKDFIGAGQTLTLGFNHDPEAGSRQNHWDDGWYDNAFDDLYTQDQINEFARNGNPDTINSLLIPVIFNTKEISK